MNKDFNELIWGDNWWIEDDRAWFVLDRVNILCCLNLDTNECELAVCVPLPEGKMGGFSITPYCIKHGNNVYCMPGYGNSIWVYRIDSSVFSEIRIDNPDNEILTMDNFWIYDGKMFAVSLGLRQIIQIDIREQKIDCYYNLGYEKSITESVKAKTAIYSIADSVNKIYRFDLLTKEIVIYELPNKERKLYTICFDGKKFWMSGYRKEIYVWDQEQNEIEILDDFPPQFGIYNFNEDTNGEIDYESDIYECLPFSHCRAIGSCVWFIPYRANEIIYVDKEEHKLNIFEIFEEVEDKESILKRTDTKYKYNLEYVKDDRYLGLFSAKYNCILEIDTKELTYVYKRYDNSFVNKALIEYAEVRKKNYFYESIGDSKLFDRLLRLKDYESCKMNESNIGMEIYKKVTEDIVELTD